MVDYRNWEKNPRAIDFKQGSDGKTETYSILQLEAFGIDGYDQYIRAVVVKDMLPVNINNLEREGTEKKLTDTAFLRTIVSGEKLSLYELEDEEKVHFFIKEKGKDFEELIYKILVNENNSTITVTRNIFRDQLRRFAFNNNSLQSKIDRAAYKEDDLKKIVLGLNGMSAVSGEKKALPRTSHRFFVAAGLSYNRIDFSGSASNNFKPLKADPYMGYVAEAGVDFLSKRGQQNLFFRFRIRYNNNSYNGEGDIEGNLVEKDHKQYQLKMNIISPGVYISYAIVRTDLGKLFLGLGAAYNLTSYTKNTLTSSNPATGSSTQDDYLKLGDWGDVLFCIGYDIKNRFEIKLDNRLSGTFTNFLGISAKNPSSFLTVGVFF